MPQLPRLMSGPEIAALFGVSRQRAHVLTKSKGFPDPAQVLGIGAIWLADDVEAWAESTGRAMPGRTET
ncbi:helix-turn-helix transcriptional regulator [Nocardioides sp. NPDC101246]|uniref:helix-turn-helix transcriptional regulator n=1 Tax=Nocardioides sp. NPDC101246 TaxID=3364336 RepID=UPI00380F614E